MFLIENINKIRAQIIYVLQGGDYARGMFGDVHLERLRQASIFRSCPHRIILKDACHVRVAVAKKKKEKTNKKIFTQMFVASAIL